MWCRAATVNPGRRAHARTRTRFHCRPTPPETSSARSTARASRPSDRASSTRRPPPAARLSSSARETPRLRSFTLGERSRSPSGSGTATRAPWRGGCWPGRSRCAGSGSAPLRPTRARTRSATSDPTPGTTGVAGQRRGDAFRRGRPTPDARAHRGAPRGHRGRQSWLHRLDRRRRVGASFARRRTSGRASRGGIAPDEHHRSIDRSNRTGRRTSTAC